MVALWWVWRLKAGSLGCLFQLLTIGLCAGYVWWLLRVFVSLQVVACFDCGFVAGYCGMLFCLRDCYLVAWRSIVVSC